MKYDEVPVLSFVTRTSPPPFLLSVNMQAGENVVFLTVEDFEAVPADDDEVDVMFIVLANGSFTINSVGFTDPGLRLQ
jgi:hypothetical protein